MHGFALLMSRSWNSYRDTSRWDEITQHCAQQGRQVGAVLPRDDARRRVRVAHPDAAVGQQHSGSFRVVNEVKRRPDAGKHKAVLPAFLFDPVPYGRGQVGHPVPGKE